MGTRVYIGRVSNSARERDIERFFKGYGHIRDVMLKNGYCFVEFDDERDADDAVFELNGKELLGERVVIEHAKGARRDRGGGGGGGGGYNGIGGGRSYRREPSWLNKYGAPTRTDYRIIVENLSSRASWQDLKDYMRQAGEVTYADAHKQRKNEGVVDFATKAEMKRAIEKLDGTEINGRKIKMIEDRPSRRGRSRSRSDSRSRSRSRSRSQSRSRSRSRRSRSRSASRSRSRSRSHSEQRSKSRSRSKSNSRSKSKSRSASPDNGKGNEEES